MSLDASEKDILKEIGNIGAGNASKALSDMTNHKIDVGFPMVEMKEVEKIPEILDDEGLSDLVAVWLDVDLEEEDEEEEMGRLILLMDRDSASNLADYLNGKDSEDNELGDMDISALKETGNILSGSALTSLTDFLDIQFMEGIPNLDQDNLETIMEDLIFDITSKDTEAMVFRTCFSLEEKISAYFLFIFEENGRKVVLNKLS